MPWLCFICRSVGLDVDITDGQIECLLCWTLPDRWQTLDPCYSAAPLIKRRALGPYSHLRRICGRSGADCGGSWPAGSCADPTITPRREEKTPIGWVSDPVTAPPHHLQQLSNNKHKNISEQTCTEQSDVSFLLYLGNVQLVYFSQLKFSHSHAV